MIKIEYNLTSYEDFFRHLSKSLKLKITDNIICFTPDKGTGFIRFIDLPSGVQLMVYDYIPKEDLLYHRKKSDKEYFVLRFDELTGLDGTVKSSIFLGNTRQEWLYMASANCQLRQINIIFSRKWLEDYLSDEKKGELLGSYITFKSPFIMYEVMDAEYRRLLYEILNVQSDKHFEQMIISNRVALIIERFFAKVYKSIESGPTELKISSRELRSIKLVESELLKDFSQPPPSIAQLARVAAMSQSKLKILFKDFFDSPINQYYQEHRMHKAKAMLLSKKYLVRDVAVALGFSSVSSFNKAFVKAFDQLPIDITPVNK